MATKAYDQEMDDDFACEWMNDRNEEMSETTMTSSNVRNVTLHVPAPYYNCPYVCMLVVWYSQTAILLPYLFDDV